MIATKFKRDHHTRAALFAPASFQHQGLNLGQKLKWYTEMEKK